MTWLSVLAGKWLRLRKADGHIIAMVADYDPYRHQHQLATGETLQALGQICSGSLDCNRVGRLATMHSLALLGLLPTTIVDGESREIPIWEPGRKFLARLLGLAEMECNTELWKGILTAILIVTDCQ